MTESGPMALRINSLDSDMFTTTVGIKAGRDFMLSDSVIVTPKMTAAWQHNWADNDVNIRSHFVGAPVSFSTRSAEQDRDAALLGAELTLCIKQSKGWDIGLKTGYGADLREKSTDHNIFAGVELLF